MKRWLNSLLVLALVLALAGCGAPSEGSASYPNPPVESGSVDLPGEGGDSSRLPDASNQGDTSQLPDDSNQGDISQLPDASNQGDTSRLPNNGDVSQLPEEPEENLPEDGSYTSKEDVALYLHLYGHLPDNFITKKEAQSLGWPGGSLEPYAPGMCIGGDRFGNREGLLPSAQGRTYTECDIDTLGAKSRGAKRIVFSNDGLIYYTEDHYESFELLYGDPGDGYT